MMKLLFFSLAPSILLLAERDLKWLQDTHRVRQFSKKKKKSSNCKPNTQHYQTQHQLCSAWEQERQTPPSTRCFDDLPPPNSTTSTETRLPQLCKLSQLMEKVSATNYQDRWKCWNKKYINKINPESKLIPPAVWLFYCPHTQSVWGLYLNVGRHLAITDLVNIFGKKRLYGS